MNREEQPLGCIGWIIQELLDIIISAILFMVSYLLMGILIAFGFDNTQSIRLLSGTGLIVILFGLSIFLWALKKQKNLAKKELEASLYRDNEKSWFFKNLFVFNVFIFDYFKRKLYTIAGLALSFTGVFTTILLEIGSGDFAGYFSKENWEISYILFAIVPFVLGVIADWIKRNDHKLLEQNIAARFLTFLGVLEFYPGILLFITGLVGGRESFFAASKLNDIASLEIVLFRWIPDSYQTSASFILMNSLGVKWFGVLYFLLPLIICLNNRSLLKKHESDSFYIGDTPIEIIKDSYKMSLFILLIPLYVGWNEGWIQNVIRYVVFKLSEIF